MITVSEGGRDTFLIPLSLFSLLLVLGERHYMMKFLAKFELYRNVNVNVLNIWNLLSRIFFNHKR